MQLKLTRSQRTKGMLSGKIFFCLTARAELSPDEQALVAKYNLGTIVVYDSEARKNLSESAYAQFGEAAAATGYDGAAVRRTLWSNVRGLASMAMAALTLRVTVNDLMEGTYIECKDMGELLGAENAIREACANTKAYLETALTFDGQEEVVEF